MKRLIFGFMLLSILAVFTTCDEDALLNLQPESDLTAAQAWTNESQANSSFTGVMNRFRSLYGGDTYLHWFEHRSGHLQFGQSGGGAGTSNWRHLFNNTLIASTSPGTNWQGFYQTINGVNLALKYVPDINFSDDDEKNRMLAQAYFLRAYNFYTLARIYGDVPLPLKPYESVDDDLYPKREPVGKVLAQIKEDLESALELFPDDSPSDRVLPSKAAAEMLKTDVHIWTAKRFNGGDQDLQIAENAVDNVLSNSNYRLLDDYAQVFETAQNDELIFALYHSVEEGGSHPASEMLFQVTDLPPPFHNNPVPIASNPQRNAYTDHFIDNYLKKDPNDNRLSKNLGEFDGGGRTYLWINKFTGEWRDGARYFTDDVPIYRFAEAILFKAEILNARGNTPEALNYLNQIAERAYGDDTYYSGLTQQEAEDAILDERLIEFAIEGKAWMDYIRMGKAFERIPSLIGREGEKQGNVLLFPIDPGTISRNENITQTPGYD